MDEFDQDYFPKQCWGCADNCYECMREIEGISVAAVRELAASRKLKMMAISRMQREIEKIESHLQILLRDGKNEILLKR